MTVGLLVASILCATLNNLFLHTLQGKKYNVFLFNGLISCIWILAFAILYISSSGLGEYTLIYGIVYGLTLSGFIFFKSQAMQTGPVMITALIGCSSFILTTIFNAIYWKESVSVFEISGIIIMIVAIFLITFKKNKVKDNENPSQPQQNKISLKWTIYCIFFFIFCALTGIIFKFHQSADKEHSTGMLLIASTVSALLMFTIFVTTKLTIQKNEHININKKVLLIALLCGIVSCVYNRLNLYLSGAMASTLFFPIFNGCVVIGSFFVGWIFFKEKPTVLQYIGVGCGLLSIVLISRFFGAF